MIDLFGGIACTVDFIGGILGLVLFGMSFMQALSLFALQFSTYSHDMTLQQCGEGFQCSNCAGWSRVECGGATCTLVLVYGSIRLRDTCSVKGHKEVE